MTSIETVPVIEEEKKKPNKSLVAKGVTIAQTTWKYKHFVPVALTTTISYYVRGPEQQSWPLELVLFTTLARYAAASRPKRDPSKPIDPIKATQATRKAINLEEIMPQLKSGFAVEVSVPVKKRGLKGLLESADSKEDGSRHLEAEWVVHNSIVDKSVTPTNKVVLYFHGGAYMLLSKKSHRPILVTLSKASKTRFFSVNYRLSPEVIFPAALHDAVASYQYLTEDLGIPSSNIIVGGDSAGGGLSMALLLYLRDMKMPQLGGGLLLSPWADKTASLGSWESNANYDYLSMSPGDDQMNPARLYVGNELHDERIVHPYVSSCVADHSSLPPLLIQSGGAEVLRDEHTVLAYLASGSGVDVTHEIFESAIHVPQGFLKSEVAKAAIIAIGEWIVKQDGRGSGNYNYGGIDNLLSQEYERRQLKLSKEDKVVNSNDAKIPQPKFVFEATAQPPPAVVLRQNAHPAIVKAVERFKKVLMEKEITNIYFAKRASPGGILSNLPFLGRSHL